MKPPQKIEKLGTAKFKVSTDGITGSELELDFNPIIKEFSLSGDYLLIHFQARPKDYRRWGMYQSSTDSYISIDLFDLDLPKGRSLHLDETKHKTVPTGVILLENTRMALITTIFALIRLFTTTETIFLVVRRFTFRTLHWLTREFYPLIL